MEKLVFNLPNSEPEELKLDLSEFLIDPDIEEPEAMPVLSIIQDGEIIPILTEQNISLLFGPAKSRKSTLLKSICQAVFNGTNEKMHSDYYRNDVAIFDTEQDRNRCWKMSKILKRLTNKKVNYFAIVGKKKEIKRGLVELFLETHPNCGFIILDNIVHFLTDFNSVTESADLCEWLLMLKDKFNVHILLILHENSSGGIIKPRGHLGSNLVNLSETIIRIEKDQNDRTQSIVSAFETRGKEFNQFTITMDYQGIPFLSDFKEYKTIKR